MSKISRRQLITTGLATAAGASGLVVAEKLAGRYGLIPPDFGGIYGPGETLTYAAQRLLTRHSLAREFSRSQISRDPFANEVAPLGEPFHRLEQGAFLTGVLPSMAWLLAQHRSRLRSSRAFLGAATSR